MNNRNLLTLVLLGLSLLFITACSPSPQEQTTSGQSPTVALQLYSFRAQLAEDLSGTLAKIQGMGIEKVELAGTYGLSAADFMDSLSAYGLTPIGTGADFAQLDTNTQQVINDAKALGVEYVTCFWIPHQKDSFQRSDAQKAIEVFNRAGKLLRENGIAFYYHPHGYEFGAYQDGTLFDLLATELNPDYVNFEMDVFWVKHPGQAPVALMQKYPGRFPVLHMKDRLPGTEGNPFGRADVETNVTLGTGDVGIADILAEAKKGGVRYLVIEDESSRSMEQVPLSIAFMKERL